MRIITGLQPSGKLHVGNYFGAMEPAVRMQESGESFYFLADYHAMRTVHDAHTLRENCSTLATDILAVGLDPEKCVFFRQSAVPEVNELAWILSTVCPMGLLERCHSYKDKIAKGFSPSNALFTYPVLMAADILLSQTDLVPVGIDQKQHLELSRDIAVRFNGLYGNTFRIPDAYIPKTSAKIMSLADPTKKMSKSDENVKATVFLLDSKDSIIKKFKSAVTDSEMEVVYREGKDGINNLMSIYSAITKKSYEEIQREFEGKGYGDFKTAVGETVAEELRPIREEYDRLMADKAYLESCYRDGAQKARTISQRTLDKVYKKIGFLPASL